MEQLKFIFLGNVGVGKSTLIKSHITGDVSHPVTATIGFSFEKQTTHVDGRSVTMTSWDVSGDPAYLTITASMIRGSHVIFYVYDVSSSESFNSIFHWYELSATKVTNISLVTKVLIANKIDLRAFEKPKKPCVTKEQGEAFAREHGMYFYEVCAFSTPSINALFLDVLEKMDPSQSVLVDPSHISLTYTPSPPHPDMRQACYI